MPPSWVYPWFISRALDVFMFTSSWVKIILLHVGANVAFALYMFQWQYKRSSYLCIIYSSDQGEENRNMADEQEEDDSATSIQVHKMGSEKIMDQSVTVTGSTSFQDALSTRWSECVWTVQELEGWLRCFRHPLSRSLSAKQSASEIGQRLNSIPMDMFAHSMKVISFPSITYLYYVNVDRHLEQSITLDKLQAELEDLQILLLHSIKVKE